MKNFTVAILTKNSESTLSRLLSSCQFANEIILVDDNSTDGTLTIAKKHGAKIFVHSLNNDFAAQRNYALENATNDWVLFVDADEVLNSELIDSIEKLPENTEVDAFKIKRTDYFWKQKMNYGETGNCYLTRLVDRRKGEFKRSVHEVYSAKGSVDTLCGEFEHYAHNSVQGFLVKINFYSTLNAQTFLREKRRTNVFDIFFTPIFKFMYTFFLKLGFMDGAAGFVYSFMMSFHSFLTRAKLYSLTHSKK